MYQLFIPFQENSYKHRIAVVVPVYKVERYLLKCLDSLEAQTYRNFVVFAVDDGSPDKSGRMLDEYAGTHSWLRVFHKTNGGVSSARNLALDQIEADGGFEYISFIDPDDWVSPEFLQDFINNAVKHDVDYVVCGYNQFAVDGIRNPWEIDHYPECELDRKGIAEQYFQLGKWTLRGPSSGRFICNRLYKTSKIAGMRFDTNMPAGEDQLFMVLAMKRLLKGVHLRQTNYQYRLRKSSLSHTAGRNVAHEFGPFAKLVDDPEFDPAVLIGIKRTLLDIWWHSLKESFLLNDKELRKGCLDLLPKLRSEGFLDELPKRYRNRFVMASLGEAFLSIYFRLRGNKHSSAKEDAYFP